MREYFSLTVVLMLCLSTYGCSNTKSRKIDEALEKRQEEKHSLKEQIKKDKTKPIIKHIKKTLYFFKIFSYLTNP